MHVLMGPVPAGIVHYLLFAFVTIFVGRGLLCLLRLRVERRAELLVSVVLALVFWTIALGVAGGVRLAIRPVMPWLWGASLALACLGLLWRPRVYLSASIIPTLVCVTLPLVCMPERVASGLLESSASIGSDGWVYMAGGQFLYDHGRTAYHGTNLIYQVGSYFQNHRFITFTMLGFLSPWGRAGDTTSVGSLLQAFSLFTFACAVQLFWTTRSVSRRVELAGTAFTMLCGWTHLVIWGNWFENGLALAYMPAMVATLRLWGPRSWCRWLLLGGEAAALFYTFPEGSPATFLFVALIAAWQLWRERASWACWLFGSVAAVLLAAALLTPALGTLLVFAEESHTGRIWCVRETWEYMALLRGMYDLGNYPGVFWALGGETWGTQATATGNVLGMFLTLAALVGLVQLARRGEWGFATGTACLAGGAVLWVTYFHHPYVAFKLLSVGWWCLVVAIVTGVCWLLERLSGRLRLALLTGCATVGLLSTHLPLLQNERPINESLFGERQLKRFREVQRAKKLIGDKPVIVAADEWLASSLAAYYLRDCCLHVATPRNWLAHRGISRYRERQPRPQSDRTCYVVVDKTYKPACLDDLAECGELVWSNEVFDIVKLDCGRNERPMLLRLQPELGRGRNSDGGKCFWLGDQEVVLSVWVPRAGTLKMSATFCSRQGLGKQQPRDLEITTGVPAKVAKGFVDIWAPRSLRRESRALGYRAQTVVRPGGGDILIPVHDGLNQIALRCLDWPPNDPDTETDHLFLLGVMGMKMSMCPSPSRRTPPHDVAATPVRDRVRSDAWARATSAP